MSPTLAAKSESVEDPVAAVAAVDLDSGADLHVDTHVDDVVIGAGTSFYWAMRILPLPRRRAIFAVYVFCREVDDVADSCSPADEKIAALAEWRAEIERLYAGAPSRTTTRALAGALTEFGLEKEAFLAIIDGMEMDANGPVVAPGMAELETYCARVAAAVGLLCVRIFGEDGEDGRKVAASLGLALQLTNILRDLKEDAEMGRLYMPRELLEAHGIASRDPVEVLSDPNLPLACRELAALAEEKFADAERAMARCLGRTMRPAIIMMKVYQRTLRQLLRRDWRHVATYEPSRFTRIMDKAGKLFIALRYGLV